MYMPLTLDWFFLHVRIGGVVPRATPTPPYKDATIVLFFMHGERWLQEFCLHRVAPSNGAAVHCSWGFQGPPTSSLTGWPPTHLACGCRLSTSFDYLFGPSALRWCLSAFGYKLSGEVAHQTENGRWVCKGNDTVCVETMRTTHSSTRTPYGRVNTMSLIDHDD